MFVEALVPLGSAFDNIVRHNQCISELQRNNELTQQRADTATLNAENRKRELDIIENKIRNYSQSYSGTHIQMLPVRDESED